MRATGHPQETTPTALDLTRGTPLKSGVAGTGKLIIGVRERTTDKSMQRRRAGGIGAVYTP